MGILRCGPPWRSVVARFLLVVLICFFFAFESPCRSFFFSSGSFLTALLGWLILPAFSYSMGWRVLCVVLGVASCLCGALRWFLPESPAFLAQSGRKRESQDVIAWIIAFNASKSCCFPGTASASVSLPLSAQENSTLLPRHDDVIAVDGSNIMVVELVSTQVSGSSDAVAADSDRTHMLEKQEHHVVTPRLGALTALFAELQQSAVLFRCAICLWFCWLFGMCGYVNLNVFFPELLDRLGHGSNVNAVVFTALGLIGKKKLIILRVTATVWELS